MVKLFWMNVEDVADVKTADGLTVVGGVKSLHS
jgi:hypothetical protein